MAITRYATLKRQPSTPLGTPGKLISDTGAFWYTIEKQYLDDKPDISCEKPGDYPSLFQYSSVHGCNNYHLQTTDGRTGLEIHSANVQEQLKGCIAIGTAPATFTANSIYDGMPSVECPGVVDSKTALAQFEKDMQDKDGNQEPFILTIIG